MRKDSVGTCIIAVYQSTNGVDQSHKHYLFGEIGEIRRTGHLGKQEIRSKCKHCFAGEQLGSFLCDIHRPKSVELLVPI